MYSVFRDLAIIILSAKFFALFARKCKAPQVVGEIIAGLIIGPCLLNLVQTSDAISIFAEIGVVLLMFSTGLGTNLKELMRAGPIATLIACVGVFVPLVGGTLLYSAFYGFAAVGSPEFYRALFIGTIMTATSVSITVATLQELGHLKSFLGTTIVSAAVIDDVIGIIVLTCVLGASSGEGTGIGGVLIQTVLFFLVAIGVGVVIHFVMKWLDKRNPHTQRITIVSMAFCFAMAYIAEQYFGIADITGAYIAGIVLCAMDDAPYVERRVDISNYVIFAPVFFASIGLKTDISGLTPEILLFCICFVIVALLTKIIGCGLAAKICRFNWGDSLKVGVGMMTRGEVALIVAQKGLEVGVVDPVYFTAVILLIVVSSVATPLVLKALFTKMPPVPHPSQTKA
ncbi:MAG: cation:proton antiporter [Gemmiger formicilis]|uniref:cation:proton antiporter n=1 Tax=Gemmiger formicilis TaxID=745368 RepID=UPI003FF0F93D|nr:cation:proton antiporter [Gemmiger formicilis]MDD6523090.1 cation:proton antiporter [Gemmiger formicilis]